MEECRQGFSPPQDRLRLSCAPAPVLQHWVRPDEYRPERWLAEGEAEFGPILQEAFIPFGGGSRICIGMYFAVRLLGVGMHCADWRGPSSRIGCAPCLLNCFAASNDFLPLFCASCPSAMGQIMEAQVIAAQVLQKVKFEPVPGFEPDAVMRMTLSSKNGIRLRALPRSSGDGRPSGQQTAATSV